MKIAKEGYSIIVKSTLILSSVAILAALFVKNSTIESIILAAALLLLIFIFSFFREPRRYSSNEPHKVYAPADGKIVAIERVYEPEYLKEEVTLVSIFMSVLNVHINWFPIKGEITYHKYHPGNYLVAMHPKSSTLNERTTVAIKNSKGEEIVVRQIAGYIARRIVCYAKEGKAVEAGNRLGFIKFGSRVDLYLPLDSKIELEIGDKVKALESVVATFSDSRPL
ncbi:MAG: phosphatidylserine decarboxylase family protein [Bacteroidales bacterium]